MLPLPPTFAATFAVTTTADSGPGSLRTAIEAANAAPGADTILFRIPLSDPGFAGGVFTIRPTSELPAVQGPTLLDGYSQVGFIGNTNPDGPEIVLNGALAGGATGLVVLGENSVIRGLVINGFTASGLGLGGSNNRVEGCYIGTNASGSAAVPNGAEGISLGGNRQTVGGTEARSRNVISGNTRSGVFSGGGNGHVLAGNFIGTNAAGTAALPNGELGIFLQNAFETLIGGTVAGSRNLISGNAAGGVELESGNNNRVQGNYIGTDVRGGSALPNQGRGVTVTQTSGTVVGGTTGAARNVISGNRRSGVQLVHTGSDRVQGNYIGLNAAGTAALPNAGSGVELIDDGGYQVGGTEAGARNIISGNDGDGVLVFATSSNNVIQGNYIGTNPVGRTPIPNGGHGVYLVDGARSNQVGGATSGARNLISGNLGDGVRISGNYITDPTAPFSAFNRVQGNFIGTDYSGGRALPNGGNGVSLFPDTSNNTIGGNTADARNLISGNRRSGVALSSASSNLIAGNYIGTGVSGSVALPNGEQGVYLTDDATNNLVGGTTPDSRNLISGNLDGGVYLDTAGELNRVKGNYVGTNANGSGALPNRFGVALFNTLHSAEIGGSEPGGGNLISGNQGSGIAIELSNSVRVLGNLIGTNALGTAALPNGGDGIVSGNSGAHRIGGSTLSERNLISGNRGNGISLSRGTDRTLVQGNYIGVNISGTGALPNAQFGVQLFEGGPLNSVGGADAGSRNVISGNLRGGIDIAFLSEDNDVRGNYIGTNASGTLAVANGGPGVLVEGDSKRNRIGSPAAGGGNVISGNAGDGVLLNGASGTDLAPAANLIQGNRIGTTALGAALPNRGHGVELTGPYSEANQIGGAEPGAGNWIAYNLGDGVLLRQESTFGTFFIGNPIRANSIYENQGLGINLQPVGESPSTVTPNDFQDPDPGPNRLQNFPVLTGAVVQPGLTTLTGTLNSTPNSPFALDFFRSPAPDPSGYGEGQQYLGSATVATDASGNASFTFAATGIGAGEPGFFTATATNTVTRDTGEFSAALQGSSMTLAAGSFPEASRSRAVQSGQIIGQITDAGGAGMAGVRLSLHQPTGAEIYSPDWDPNRLHVTWTDSTGAFRFTGLTRGRYLVLAYAPGVYFTPRASLAEVENAGAAEVNFTAAGTDNQSPIVTVTAPAGDNQASHLPLAEGTVQDPGGAGVRAVLVRLSLLDPEGGQPPCWLDWQTGSWDPKPAAGQTRWAHLDATGTGWKLDLPRLAPGTYRLEVQAYDWAGYASQWETTAFRVR